MNISKRYVYFGMGVLIGLVIVGRIMGGHAQSKKAREIQADKADIPGMLLDYAQKGEPVYDDKGVLESANGPGALGFARTRRVLTGGRVRYSEGGVRLPDDFLVITEYYSEPGEPSPRSHVARYDFAYADRVRLEVKSAPDSAVVSAALKPLGGRLSLEPGSRVKLTVRFDKPTLTTVDKALVALKTIPEVVSAEPVKLDWKSQLIK